MGVRNGLWRLLFWLHFGAFCWLFVHNMRPSDPWPSLGGIAFLLAFFWVFSAHFATLLHKEICGMVNEAREEDYTEARAIAQKAMPVEALKFDPETNGYTDVRRQLIDPRMGLTVRR